MTPSSKQRIIGAFVLCGLALIFFPLLFDLSNPKKLDTTEQIPTMPEIEPEIISSPEPVPDLIPPKPESRAFQPSLEPEQATPERLASEQTVSDKAVSDKTVPELFSEKPTNPEIHPASLDAEGLPEAWLIQAGSFSDKAKANELCDRLKADGFKSYVQAVSVPQGTMHRVFVGPKVLKRDALAEQQKIEQKYKLQTILKQFKP